jgi:hypothetical protein
MKISCGISGYYKEADKWKLIDFEDVETYEREGFETELELYIYAINEHSEFTDNILKTRRFKKTGKNAGHNIAFMDHVFQYRELTNDIFYLNRIINI